MKLLERLVREKKEEIYKMRLNDIILQMNNLIQQFRDE